jgi:ATP-dependent DNA helicase RecG
MRLSAQKGCIWRRHYGEVYALQSASIPDSKGPNRQDEPLNEPLNELLNETVESKIIQIMQTTPGCTYDTLTKSLDISRSTAKRVVKNLIERGKIERKGGKKHGYWDVHK